MEKRYSTDGDNFGYTTPAQVFAALDAEGELLVGVAYYETAAREVQPCDLLNADDILERANDAGYELVAEAWDMRFAAGVEATRELQGLLDDWCRKHAPTDGLFEPSGPVITRHVTRQALATYEQSKPGEAV